MSSLELIILTGICGILLIVCSRLRKLAKQITETNRVIQQNLLQVLNDKEVEWFSRLADSWVVRTQQLELSFKETTTKIETALQEIEKRIADPVVKAHPLTNDTIKTLLQEWVKLATPTKNTKEPEVSANSKPENKETVSQFLQMVYQILAKGTTMYPLFFKMPSHFDNSQLHQTISKLQRDGYTCELHLQNEYLTPLWTLNILKPPMDRDSLKEWAAQSAQWADALDKEGTAHSSVWRETRT